MARSRVQPAAASLVGLISDPEDDTLSDEILAEAPDSNQENFIPGRTVAQKPKTLAVNGRIRQAVTKKANPIKSRTAMIRKPAKREIAEEEDEEETEDVDDLDEMEPKTFKQRVQPVQKAKKPSIGQRVPAPTAATRQSPRKNVRINGTNHAQPQPFYELQADMSNPPDSEADRLIEELTQPIPFQNMAQSHIPVSMDPVPMLNGRRRAGSTSSNEGKNPDPVLRRKLGEITKKFEALEVRYRKLHDVGVIEAKMNFDKLKQTSDDKARISSDLITSLKKELAAQKAHSQQSHTHLHEIETQKTALADLKAQLAAARKEIADLETERIELKSELSTTKADLKANSTLAKQLSDSKAKTTSLTKQLSEAHNEQSNLQAKLAAARSASIDRQPGSAMKGIPNGKVPVMKVMTSTAEAAAAALEAQSKIDLYSDLTGLLINRIERRPEEQIDVYDCIQTGRNGTLHFKLTISTDKADAYSDADFTYLPRLDSARDSNLISLLPYYLREDISFTRDEAAKFYTRVFEIVTRRYEDPPDEENEDEEEE